LCEGESYFLEVETGFLTYLWNTGETTSSIVLSAVGNYSVAVTNQFGCEATKTYTITSSSPPTITSIDINDFSGNNNTVQINVIGSGDYHYSLNGINFQDSSFFNNVITDEYFVVIKDKNGCNPEAMQQIYVLDYPKFFTPNGDGINDIWYIKKMEQQPNATISIFDRYGKLLYSFKANQRGWDGTFNQKALLSYDYWFVLNLENGRKIKGHFSLKR
jgi:gliding motility-associated-like protein